MLDHERVDLTAAITDAARLAFKSLFRNHQERFYYCTLVTTDSAYSPYISAMSWDALERLAAAEENPDEAREMLKWSYADSPYCIYGEEYFSEVVEQFHQLPDIHQLERVSFHKECEERLECMEAAMKQLDSEGLFGVGQAREQVVVLAEVMPPDYTNTERARRLNPHKALIDWLNEAAEELE